MMRDVIEESVRLLQANEPCVLATVVNTKGMTPQKAGAKQLIRKDGSSVGTLGGGCVEGDIWYYAKQMLQEGSGPEFRHYQLNADLAAQDGLVCGGTMHFFLEPLKAGEQTLTFFEEILKASERGPAVATATVVKSRAADLPPGRRMLIRDDGSTLAAFGDQTLQKRLVRTGRELAPFGRNVLLDVGDLTVFVEGFTTTPTLVILGGGHVGLAVYQLGLGLGFRVLIIDDREEFASAERFPRAAGVYVRSFEDALSGIEIGFNSFILVATRGHRYDDMATRAAVASPARYIGLLGSKRKNLLIFRELSRSGIPVDRLREIHAPVGLNIGALTPAELAVSICAEIIQCIRGGDGGPMKMDPEDMAAALTHPVAE